MGGFFAGLAAAGIEAIPIFAARALPYGTMTAECLASLIGMMMEAIDAAGPLDGLLVAPHGATVSEEVLDVDGHWLGLLRRRFPTLPIIGTIDPHANLSPAMIAATDAAAACVGRISPASVRAMSRAASMPRSRWSTWGFVR